jgi:hypothetical protein
MRACLYIANRRPVLLLASLLVLAGTALLAAHLCAAPPHHDAAPCAVCTWCHFFACVGAAVGLFVGHPARPLPPQPLLPVHHQPRAAALGRAPPKR